MREFSHVADDVECQQRLYDCIDERGKIEKIRDEDDDRETRVGIDLCRRVEAAWFRSTLNMRCS